MKEKLTQEYLKECLTYDPDTGIFVWNERPISHFKTKRSYSTWNSHYSNKESGSENISNGYVVIRIDNKKLYMAHRLAFLYMEGYLPENQVDHINRIRNDNRWINLREVSNQCNLQNCNISINNTSGVTGVLFLKERSKFISQIMIGRKNKYLGIFKNFEDAVMARYQEELNNPLWSCSVESTAYQYLRDNNLIEKVNQKDFSKLVSRRETPPVVNGVYWGKTQNKWISYIPIDNKNKYLGVYDKFDDAVMRRYSEEINNPEYMPDNNSTAYKYLKDNNLLDTFSSMNFSKSNIVSRNKSGVCGVSWYKSIRKWVAEISVDKKMKRLGSFKNFNDAVMARYQAEKNTIYANSLSESSAYKYLKEHNLI